MYKLESGSIPRFEAAQRTLALDAAPGGEPAAQTRVSAAEASPLSAVGSGSGNAWKTMLRGLLGGDSARRRGAVQGQIELNLERVTVVRNDLNDADLEVVACGSGPARKAPEGTFEGRQTGGWMRLTQRLFRTNKDPFATSSSNSGYSAKQTRQLIART